MALTGKIEDWSLADILQLVTAEHKSGVLTLSNGKEEIRFEFHQGGIVTAHNRMLGLAPRPTRGAAATTSDAGGGGLVSFLTDTGRIRSDQVPLLLKLTSESGGDEFRAARRAGMLPPAALEEGLTEYTQDLLHRALTWQAGDYNFVARQRSSTDPGFVLRTEGLLFEGMRRIDEAPRIEEVVRPETVFGRCEGSTAPGDLTARETQMLAQVDGSCDVRTLARAARLTDYEAAKTLRRLHELGLIETRSVPSGAASEEPLLLDLTLDDLEPAPRSSRLLRVTSLVLLFAASLAFRALTHRDGEAATPAPAPGASSPELTSGHDDRVAQATRFACMIFRTAYGHEPANAGELRRAGLLPGGYWETAAEQYLKAGQPGEPTSPNTN